MLLSWIRLKSWKTANLHVVKNIKKARRNAAHAVLCLIYSKKLLKNIYTNPPKNWWVFSLNCSRF